MHDAADARPADYPNVVAAFNSAFRLDNSRGGYYAEGRTVQALVPDRASFVSYADGHVDVGLWGRDDVMTPGVRAVRQNLGLIVDGGSVVPGLADANSSLWGGTVGNQIYVWRSGVGVDAHGNLVYAAGPGLNVATLAEILRRAGCVRAMELDINTWWVSFTVYAPDTHGCSRPRTCCRRWSERPADTECQHDFVRSARLTALPASVNRTFADTIAPAAAITRRSPIAGEVNRDGTDPMCSGDQRVARRPVERDEITAYR